VPFFVSLSYAATVRREERSRTAGGVGACGDCLQYSTMLVTPPRELVTPGWYSRGMDTLHYPAVLFDLDGTLTDPYLGITRTFKHALSTLDQPLPNEATLRSWIGPPLQTTLRNYLGDAELARRAVAIYRERYHALGMYENQVYPGVPELLAALRAAGTQLYLATSKLIGPAQGILEHFGLAPFFDGVVGATLDDRISTKSQVVGAALAMLMPTVRSATVLIGDTIYDIEGARAHALPCIAVSYGYGALDELQAAEPHAIVHSVDELASVLLPRGAGA
jgi:phosphoglycolate phosphatase